MPIHFGGREHCHWDDDNHEVRFTAGRGGQSILCRITRECLESHCGNPQTAQECLDAAKDHFDAITHQFSLRIGTGMVEPDASVLLRSTDWRES